MDINAAALKDAVLGQDFLTWLWFRSEKNGWLFRMRDGGEVNVYLEQKVSVRGGEGDNVETAVVSGPNAAFAEAREGLKAGKRVDRALLRFEQDGNTWMVQVKAQDMSLNALRTPKIETRAAEGEDPDGPILEKLYLVEQGVRFLDELYAQFLQARLGPHWRDELRAFADWLAHGV
ncbi:hypothetical protein [Desulfolutivibrio sulfoxidireducens]|uniref:hypothetical protein n=1 Tax=Desulfolutivibrio sulfoxidireducens TaxID=2773299 RepID=UPI00159DFFD2|nr:hypothetical protein [Desulfolutivibrio sulfoxidireducens]QLA17295.1 hypothetical protein GD605_14960 [Desulfolutivibrio sulfoxidireducens]QLA20860.1 hypothetical protein GD604_14625 [Desulfolutivibrio sulfoxidireducens]